MIASTVVYLAVSITDRAKKTSPYPAADECLRTALMGIAQMINHHYCNPKRLQSGQYDWINHALSPALI